jgi:hypothetical protein
MEIKINTKFKNIDGTDMMINAVDPKSKPVTLAYVLKQVLLGEYKDEKINAEEKIRRYKLGIGIGDCTKEKFIISLEDIAYLRQLAGVACNTFIFGQVDSMLPK